MKTERLFKTPLGKSQEENSQLNHRECEDGRTRLDSFPRRLVFELTNKCNYQCIMCGREAATFKAHDLPMSVITSCGNILKNCEEVTLHGWGEGTLHPKLPEILAYLNTFERLRKYFVTNGSTLPRIMRSIFDHHVDLVAVSLDGATPEKNDSIRKGGSFEKVVGSIKELVREKSERGLDYPYVNLVFTAMMRNIYDLPDMVRLTHSLRLPELKVVYLTVFTDALAYESLDGRQDVVKPAFAEARELALEYGINLKLPEIQGEGESGIQRHKPCAFPWRDLYIGSDSFVRPCQSSSEKLFRITDFHTIEEAWNAPQLQSFRAKVNDPDAMPGSCGKCYHSSCANWNLRSSFVQLGENFAPDWGKDTLKNGNAAAS